MSNVNFLEKLLNGAEVEWMRLGEVVYFDKRFQGVETDLQKKILSFKHVLASKLKEISINSGNVRLLSTGKFIGFTSKELAGENLNFGEVVTFPSGGSADIKYYNGFFVDSGNILCQSQDISKYSLKYIYYFLLNQNEVIQNLYRGSGVKHPEMAQILNFPIPVPCPSNPKRSLEIQAEIVRILDKFTELTAELTAELTTELTARQKQYEYYREQLLTFKEGEVEWKKLGEVCGFKNGFAFKSSLFKESGLPIIRITNVDGKKINLSDVKYFNQTDYNENITLYEVIYGDILIAMSGATTGKIGFYDHETTAYLNQRVGKFLPKKGILNNRYLYHYLISQVDYIYVMAGGGAQPNLSSNILMDKLPIPVPCPSNPKRSLEIQAEIVRILDKFTELTAELTTELTARKKQYAYYREQLLTFKEGEVEWKKLGELAELKRGRVMSKEYLVDNAGGYPVFSSQTANNGMIGSIETFDFDGEFISWTTDGVNAGTVFHRTGKFSVTNVCGLIKINDESRLNYKFLFYWLSIEAQKYVYFGMGNPKLMSHQVEKIPIPIPCPSNPKRSLEIQAEIVRILDKFTELTTELTAELTTELTARQKQYAYYREQLLTFKEGKFCYCKLDRLSNKNITRKLARHK